MKRITFTNSMGESVELYRSPFFLTKIEGLGDVEAEVQNQRAPGQDGSSYIDATLSERYIPIEVDILKDFDENKRYLSRVFNPKLGPGLLSYENELGIREIRAVAEHVPKFTDNRPILTQKAVIDLVCHDPYWLSLEDNTEPIAEWTGGMIFPWILGDLKQPAFALSEKGYAKKIYNDGDAPAPVEIIFLGGGLNPIVQNNTTGEFIKVNRELAITDKLIINTAFGNKSVVIEDELGNRTNVFNWIDLDSTFWQLVPGENAIEYGSDSEMLESSVIINYRKKYVSA